MSGIELIKKERQEQIEKHGFTSDKDKEKGECELAHAASMLSYPDLQIHCNLDDMWEGLGWEESLWHKAIDKPYKERLIIAAALLAAEIDRISE